MSPAAIPQVEPRQPDFADLAERLRIPSLYDHQRRVINGLVAGRDGLLIAPTGSGKSECFLGAGIARDGLTLVVAPLRSLIQDQLRRIKSLGLPVRIWNSDTKDAEKPETLRMLQDGWAGFFITTPESLRSYTLSSALRGCVNLGVVDEAHCVLKDRGFRTSYAWLGSTLARINPAVRFACTATLAGADQDALIRSLSLRDPLRTILPVARGNIAISVVNRDPRKLASILDHHRTEFGIVFCATIRTAENLYDKLFGQGRSVVLYHGRLTAKQKRHSQDVFMTGRKRVGVVTDAFLLGIDKSNLSFVVHYDHPKSIEDWVQGFGRAGRDGKPAFAYGCFRGSNQGKKSRQFLINSTFPPVPDLHDVWDYLREEAYRDESASRIGENAVGNRGKFSGNAMLSALNRFRLAVADRHPTDGRLRRYRAMGNFDHVDWGPYANEKRDAQRRFDQLCELAMRPDTEIPGEIDRYFGATPTPSCGAPNRSEDSE